jgi:SAM-dependent methyltransferase
MGGPSRRVTLDERASIGGMAGQREPDRAFEGSIPEIYERYLVPMIFESYAADLVERVSVLGGNRLLEVAAGTGAVTRRMANMLPSTVAITATDLNQAMLDQAAAQGTSRPVEWQQADVMSLPFDDDSFDVVVCQFGVMFFPDRPLAYAEIRRVLRPGGTFMFNVWDRLADNDFAQIVSETVAEMFPDDPPTFIDRVPHGYHDPAAIRADLVAGGYSAAPMIETIAARSRAVSATDVAIAYCQGTPLRVAIVSRDASRLDEATTRSTAAIEREYGSGEVEGTISAKVVTVQAP